MADPATPNSPAVSSRSRYRRADVWSLVLILGGWLALLLIIPPQHEYPIIDDWIYAGSVQHFLTAGSFAMPQSSQANLVGLTLWGALWAGLFGFSYTVLTYSTLGLAALALVTFYALARAVGVGPGGALLGTALLGFNPLFVHLSYSFMTDVPFLALVLLSAYCYVRGLGGGSALWLWAGSLLAGWAFLIRQLGLLVPLAFLAYLALDGLRTQRPRWREALALALPVVVVVAGWYLWSRNIPPSREALRAARDSARFVLKPLWIEVILVRSFNILPLVAFFAWTAIVMRRTRRWLILLWAVLIPVLMYVVTLAGPDWIPNQAPSLSLAFGPWTVPLPQEMFVFGTYGNILRLGGIDFYLYPQEPIWFPRLWWLLWVLGVGLGVGLVAKVSDGLLDWLRDRLRTPLTPLAGVHLLGLLTFGVSVAFPVDFFDRYALGFIPFVILFLVRGVAAWGRRAWAYSLAALAVLALWTVLLKADQVEHDNARWQALAWLETRVGSGAVKLGWDQPGSDDARFGPTPPYQISDLPTPGYRDEYRIPYTSRLSGGTTRYVLAQARADQPPLLTR